MTSVSSNVKVMVRLRPFNQRERDISTKRKDVLQSVVKFRSDKVCAVVEFVGDEYGIIHEREREAFHFDKCFWSMPPDQEPGVVSFARQTDVFQETGKPALDAAFEGFNVCIFAYGQTGSGKTHSMLGSSDDPGISPRLVDELFERIEEREAKIPTTKCVVECMFFEIYNEKVRDLFGKTLRNCEYDAPRIRQHPTKGVYVEGLVRNTVTAAGKTKKLMQEGTNARAMAATKMNANSSRSHAIFQLQLTQKDARKGTARVATINLVDLAGSEKIKMSGATGDTLTEAKNINVSLSTLRRVIDVLIENSTSRHKKPPPFRESVLTYLLSDSLGGNSKTMMLSAVSPHESNLEDTLGTLRYALRAKAIVNKAKINEEKSKEMVDAMRHELMELRMKLATGQVDGDATNIGAGEASEEIMSRIAEREAEVKGMEEEQVRMEEILAEQRRKEAAMQAKLDVVEQQQQELTVAVSAQNRQRFAAAFRSAFLIAGEQKRIETSKAELTEAVSRGEKLASAVAELQQILVGKEETINDLTSQLADARASLLKTQNELTTERQMMAKTTANLKQDKLALQDKIELLTVGMDEMCFHQRESDNKAERMHSELIRAAHRVEQGTRERDLLIQQAESDALAGNGSICELRRKKDKYKTLLTKTRHDLDAARRVTEVASGERGTLVETVAAQHRLLMERQALVRRAESARGESEQRAAVAEQTAVAAEAEAVVLQDALQEYQAAANRWMGEHTAQQREISRLRQQVDSLRRR